LSGNLGYVLDMNFVLQHVEEGEVSFL